MANTEQVSASSVAVDSGSKIKMRDFRRQMLKQVSELVEKADELFTRQVGETDPFESFYGELRLVKPPYDFYSLYTIYEESDILQSCVEAMQRNVDGFGYHFQFKGNDLKEKKSPEAEAQLTKANDFFNQVNGEESFATVRQKAREDLEVLGSCGYEFIRNKRKELQLIYHIPFKRVRMSALTGRAVSVPVSLTRNGKEVQVNVKRYFRKFCQLDSNGKRARWFKSLGDPRDMDYRTGDYGTVAPQFRATEIWHIKNDFGGELYGMPRWIGAVMQVLGRRRSSYVNLDLFENQGIPPLLVLVSGGVLTDDGVGELEDLIRGLRGLKKFNRIGLLESTVEGLGIDEKGSAKIELKNMAEFRKEDMLFDKYGGTTKNDVRQRFRLPDLYVGQSETYTHATAKAAQTVAEEQVFIPERMDFDEKVNIQLVRKELNVNLWNYQSKGPKIVGSQELSSGVKTFAGVGAFTINHAIGVANAALGLDMSRFEEAWADYPIPIVLELIKSGRLKDIDSISEEIVENNNSQLPPPNQPKLLPMMTDKMFKSDMFSPDEQSLYVFLSNFQNLLEKNGGRVEGCIEGSTKTENATEE
jgi:PBSX family phage portal protein